MGLILTEDKFDLADRTGNTTMRLKAGSIVTPGSQQFTLSSDLIMDGSGNGLGGLDIGALANETLYFVYAVISGGAVGLVASLNQGDAGPAGFLAYKMVGGFVTDSSAQIQTNAYFSSLVPLKTKGSIEIGPSAVTNFANTLVIMRTIIISDAFIRVSGNLILSGSPGSPGNLSINLPDYAEVDEGIEKAGPPEGQFPVGVWQGANSGVLPYAGTVHTNGGFQLTFAHTVLSTVYVISHDSPFSWNVNDGFNFGCNFHASNLGPIMRGY